MTVPGWYYRFSQFMREQFGVRVYKVPVYAGFSCPNRDGTRGVGGCSFCDNASFSPAVGMEGQPVREQLEVAIARKRRRFPHARFIAYFQSYSNTYGTVEQLDELYSEALAVEGVVGLSIATRPDCLTWGIIELLEAYGRQTHLWLELGLQSAHDRTLRRINRGHDRYTFVQAIEATRDKGFFRCAHVILGLPGEDAADMLETVELLNSLNLEGVKFHHLQVMKGTPMAEEYFRGHVKALSLEEYLGLITTLLEHLSPRMVVHRLFGEVLSGSRLIAPCWDASKEVIYRAVTQRLAERGSYQGAALQPPEK